MFSKTVFCLILIPFVLGQKIASDENLKEAKNPIVSSDESNKLLKESSGVEDWIVENLLRQQENSILAKINSKINNANNTQLRTKLKSALESGNREEQVAVINEWTDEVVTNLNKLIIENNLEPVELEGFETTFKWGLFKGWVIFDQGTLEGVSTFRRQGDVKVVYEYPNLRTQVPLGFLTLNFEYRYEIKYMHMGPRGRAVGTSVGNKFTVDLSMDMISLQAKLNKFKVNKLGTVRIKLKGNPMTDWLVNIVILTVTPIIKLIIGGVIEGFVISGIELVLGIYNNIICTFLAAC